MDEIFWLTVKLLLVIYSAGWGISTIMLSGKLKRYKFWLTPWIGTIMIVVLGGILSMANMPLRSSTWIIAGIGWLITGFVLIKEKFQLDIQSRDWILAIGTSLVMLIVMLPLLGKDRFPTSISLGNLDPVTYANVGEFLIDHSVLQGGEIDVNRPYTWSVVDLVHYSYRWGPSLILGFFSIILKVPIYALYTIILNLYFALSYPILVYLAELLTSRFSYWVAGSLLFTFSLNSTLLYWLYNAFLPQFLYGGILIVFMMLYINELSEKKIGWKITRRDVLLGFSVAAIASVYTDGFLLAVGPVLLYALIQLLRKNIKPLKIIAKMMIVGTVVAPINIATVVNQIIRLVKTTTNTTFIGWEKIRFGSLFELMGFHNLNYGGDYPLWIDTISSIPLFMVMMVGLKRMKRWMLFGAYLLAYISFFVFFRYVVNNFFVFNRVIGYSIYLFALLFSIGLAELVREKKTQWLVIAVSTILLALSLKSMVRTNKLFYIHHRTVDKGLISLSEIRLDNPSERIFTPDIVLGEHDLWARVWTEHFLREHEIASLQNFGMMKTQTDSVLVLGRKNHLEYYEKSIVYESVVWESDYYLLGRVKKLKLSESLIRE